MITWLRDLGAKIRRFEAGDSPWMRDPHWTDSQILTGHRSRLPGSCDICGCASSRWWHRDSAYHPFRPIPAQSMT